MRAMWAGVMMVMIFMSRPFIHSWRPWILVLLESLSSAKGYPEGSNME